MLRLNLPVTLCFSPLFLFSAWYIMCNQFLIIKGSAGINVHLLLQGLCRCFTRLLAKIRIFLRRVGRSLTFVQATKRMLKLRNRISGELFLQTSCPNTNLATVICVVALKAHMPLAGSTIGGTSIALLREVQSAHNWRTCTAV